MVEQIALWIAGILTPIIGQWIKKYTDWKQYAILGIVLVLSLLITIVAWFVAPLFGGMEWKTITLQDVSQVFAISSLVYAIFYSIPKKRLSGLDNK